MLDLIKTYSQISVAKKDIYKTTVTTIFGIYEFIRMGCGPCNVAQTFQILIDKILYGFQFTFNKVRVSKNRKNIMDVRKRSRATASFL